MIYLCILAFITGFIFDFRAVSSISTGLLLLAGISARILNRKPLRLDKAEKFFFICLILYFILQVLGVLYTHDRAAGWARVQIKSGLVLIPLALFCSGITETKNRKSLFSPYLIILATACLYCLVFITVHIHQPFDSSIFFYHNLVSPLHQHAVYFSIYVFVALVILMESVSKKWLGFSKSIHIILILFFSIFLILLSSKLVIVFYGLYLSYNFISQIRSKQASRLVVGLVILATVLGGVLIAITKNPIKQRFADILHGNIGIVNQERFDKGDYFNGIQFRILEWKFVGEILNQRGAWLKGVSPGDAQPVLDSLYIAKNMYTGEAARRDRGFLSYNTHNSFLEALLQSGIVGLLILLLACYFLLRMAWQKKERGLSFIIALLLAWLFSESAFESQYGILIFTFFPLFFSAGEKRLTSFSNAGTGPVQNQIDRRDETNHPLVSVILPTYNRLDMLQEAIASVQAQTFPNWELIIVDDGSTDNTVETIKKMSDPRIQLIALPHTGHISNLRNAAAKISKGEWLAFLDSDDLWMPHKLERQLATLNKEKKKWVYGLFEYVDQNNQMIYKSQDKFPLYAGNVVKEIISGKAGICICSVLVQKKLFDEIGGFSSELEIKGDYEFFLRLALHEQVAITEEIILRVRDHPNRSYKSASYPHERSVTVYESFIRLRPGEELEKLARRQLAFLLSEASVHRFAKGYYWLALRQLSSSLWNRDKPRHWLSALKRGIYAAFKKNNQHPAKKGKAEDVAAYHS